MIDDKIRLPKLTKHQIWAAEISFWVALGTGLCAVNTFMHSHKGVDLFFTIAMFLCMFENYVFLHVIPRENDTHKPN